ncbi:hypothetical protein DXG01_005381 [Tephrocybe rancida]|nr:hypothetical protein DXG01_005381 [Tephrocybe rancida]
MHATHKHPPKFVSYIPVLCDMDKARKATKGMMAGESHRRGYIKPVNGDFEDIDTMNFEFDEHVSYSQPCDPFSSPPKPVMMDTVDWMNSQPVALKSLLSEVTKRPERRPFQHEPAYPSSSIQGLELGASTSSSRPAAPETRSRSLRRTNSSARARLGPEAPSTSANPPPSPDGALWGKDRLAVLAACQNVSERMDENAFMIGRAAGSAPAPARKLRIPAATKTRRSSAPYPGARGDKDKDKGKQRAGLEPEPRPLGTNFQRSVSTPSVVPSRAASSSSRSPSWEPDTDMDTSMMDLDTCTLADPPPVQRSPTVSLRSNSSNSSFSLDTPSPPAPKPAPKPKPVVQLHPLLTQKQKRPPPPQTTHAKQPSPLTRQHPAPLPLPQPQSARPLPLPLPQPSQSARPPVLGMRRAHTAPVAVQALPKCQKAFRPPLMSQPAPCMDKEPRRSPDAEADADVDEDADSSFGDISFGMDDEAFELTMRQPVRRVDYDSESDLSPEPDEGDERDMWVPSESEAESFGNADGADEDGTWPVEIISEEVAMNGWGKEPVLKYEYTAGPYRRALIHRAAPQAEWKNWSRPDGTKTTWDKDLLHEDDIDLWTRKESERRRRLAAQSTDIDVSMLTNLNVHLIQTQYRQHAVDEKLKLRRPRVNMEELTARNLAAARAADSHSESVDEDEGELGPVYKRLGLKAPRIREKAPKAGSSNPHPPAPPSSTSAASDRRAPSTRASSSTLVASPAPTPVKSRKVLRRSATASISEFAPSSQPSALSSSQFSAFALFPSAKAKGKQRARSPSFLEDEMNIPAASSPARATPGSARGKKRERERALSPASTLADDEAEEERVHKKSRVRKALTARVSQRSKLAEEWTTIARRTNAARISITNDVDDEEVPPLPKGFRYIESEYFYSNKVPKLDESDKGMFVRCECRPKAKCTALCSCQELSELFVEGKKVLAYTPDRLFTFKAPRGVEVIECNSECSCDPQKCPNRVAQQPRDVPIEVFKTPDRGWGVRSPMPIHRGKVLGIYTGLLILREVADALPEHQKSYLFDVDGREGRNEKGPEERYSVDSMAHVVYDTIPEMNMPYIAFVAKKDIPAGTEFLFDYDPMATTSFIQRKKKGTTKHAAFVHYTRHRRFDSVYAGTESERCVDHSFSCELILTGFSIPDETFLQAVQDLKTQLENFRTVFLLLFFTYIGANDLSKETKEKHARLRDDQTSLHLRMDAQEKVLATLTLDNRCMKMDVMDLNDKVLDLQARSNELGQGLAQYSPVIVALRNRPLLDEARKKILNLIPAAASSWQTLEAQYPHPNELFNRLSPAARAPLTLRDITFLYGSSTTRTAGNVAAHEASQWEILAAIEQFADTHRNLFNRYYRFVFGGPAIGDESE